MFGYFSTLCVKESNNCWELHCENLSWRNDKPGAGSVICSNFGLKMNTTLKNFKNNVTITDYTNG